MKKVDLHVHTTASDGIYSPVDIIDLAVREGIAAMAITDHDTIDGLEEAVRYAKKIGFRIYPSIEFSIDYDMGSFHLIGLDIDFRCNALREATAELTGHRRTRVYRMVEDLARHGVEIPLHEVIEMAGGGSAGRPHVARVLVNHGYGSSVTEIFKNYLVKGKPGYVKKVRIAFEEAIRIIRASGGVPVIAHPVSLDCRDLDEFEERLDGFVKAGVEGIEAYAALHSREQAEAYRAIAERRGLLITGGSDFHGDKNEIIGTYDSGIPVPFEVYEMVEEYLKRR